MDPAPHTVITIGLDDGYAYTKVAMPDGRVFAVPSRGRVGHANVTWLDHAKRTIQEYETEGQTYAVGDIDGESTEYDAYPYSGLNRAIVQHALQTAGLAGLTVHAISGLPVSAFYFRDGNQRSESIHRKAENLKKPVQPTDGRLAAGIAFHDVIPEALAAWYDYVIIESADGVTLDADRASAPVAVIDIGGRTTDYVVVADHAVQHDSSGSQRCGLLDVRQHIANALRARFDLDQISERMLSESLADGTVRLYGIGHDISAIRREAMAELVERIHSATRRHLGRGADLERVLFVGGGSLVLAEQLRDWFPNQTLAPLPAFANARGMRKYLQYVCQGPAC